MDSKVGSTLEDSIPVKGVIVNKDLFPYEVLGLCAFACPCNYLLLLMSRPSLGLMPAAAYARDPLVDVAYF